MPSSLIRAGRDKIMQRGIKIAESSLPSWLTEAAMEARDAVLAALTTNVNSRILQPVNPAGDSILFWDASAGAYVPLSHTAPLVISGTTLSISAATGSATGLMSAADKAKFDAATAAEVNSTVVMRDINGNSNFGSIVLSDNPTAVSHATRKDYVDGKVAAVTYSTLGTVPTSSLPPLAINETFPVATQAAMLALTAQRGDMAIRSDNGRTYVLATDSPSTLADWKEVMAAGQVQSVAGKTGVVALVKGDVGLGNVDNTSDANKPVSTAQAAAFVPRWKNGTAYAAGDPVITPTNMVMTARSAHTSSASFATDVAKWDGMGTAPYGHMGKTSAFQATGTWITVTMDAAQELRGGMTFDNANDALVVPVTGRYRVHIKGYFTGSSSGGNAVNIFVNGVRGDAALLAGIYDKVAGSCNKYDSADVSIHTSGVVPFTAGDKVALAVSSNVSTWGTNGYNGSYLEIEYVGGP